MVFKGHKFIVLLNIIRGTSKKSGRKIHVIMKASKSQNITRKGPKGQTVIVFTAPNFTSFLDFHMT